MEYDDLKSNEDWIVVEGKDVLKILDEMSAKGLDDIGSPAELYENVSDDSEVGAIENDFTYRSLGNTGDGTAEENSKADTPKETQAFEASDGQSKDASQLPANSSNYFLAQNMSLMPNWAREKFLKGEHKELVEGSKRFGNDPGSRRLEVIVSADRAKTGARNGGQSKSWTSSSEYSSGNESGTPQTTREQAFEIQDRGFDSAAAQEEGESSNEGAKQAEWTECDTFDCSAFDVALDYNIPVEFIIDAMQFFGVQTPILPTDGVRDKLTTEEVEQLLLMLTSFDAMDLADRYSDRTIRELAEDYDLDVDEIISVCKSENVFLPLFDETRLQLTREDRVLDIVLGRAAPGEKYPCIMEGLLVKNQA